MGTKMMDKFLGIIGFDDTEEQQEKTTAVEQAESQHNKRKGAQVVSLHSGRQLRVVVCEPGSFEEAQGIADNLKNRRAVIINLEKAGQDQARRIVDFISGTTFALGGSMQKVGQGIFLFVPSSIDISNEITRETKEKSIFPWVKSE